VWRVAIELTIDVVRRAILPYLTGLRIAMERAYIASTVNQSLERMGWLRSDCRPIKGLLSYLFHNRPTEIVANPEDGPVYFKLPPDNISHL